MTTEDLSDYITVSLIGSGHAALHMTHVDGYWDIQQTGIGRYKTYEEAVAEARDWSRSDEIRLSL